MPQSQWPAQVIHHGNRCWEILDPNVKLSDRSWLAQARGRAKFFGSPGSPSAAFKMVPNRISTCSCNISSNLKSFHYIINSLPHWAGKFLELTWLIVLAARQRRKINGQEYFCWVNIHRMKSLWHTRTAAGRCDKSYPIGQPACRRPAQNRASTCKPNAMWPVVNP